MELQELKDRLVKALDESERIRVKYAGKADTMTAEETATWTKWLDEADALKAQIDVVQRDAKIRAAINEPGAMLPLATRSGAPVSAEGASAQPALAAKIATLPNIDMDAVQWRDKTQRRAWKSYFGAQPLSEMPPAVKAIVGMEGDAGGFLVIPQELALRLVALVKDQVFIRSFATVQMLDKAQSLGVPTLDTDIGDPTWTDEIDTGVTDTVKPFGKRALSPHPLARRVLISNKLLRQASLDPETIVLDRLSYKVGRVEEVAFMTGSGQNQPLGLFTASTDGIDTSRDVSAATNGTIAGDDLITVRHNLKPQYWGRATWVMHRLVLAAIRKLKDAQGNYLWQPGLGGYVAQGTALVGGNPDTILGLPVIMSEMAPSSITHGDYVALLGDLSFYWIADALDMQIQRLVELYAESNQVEFIIRRESDGMPVLAEAFTRLMV